MSIFRFSSDTRVLIAEDEALIAMQAEDAVSDMGFTVAANVATLAAGMTAAAEQRIDAALLDVTLGAEQVWPLADVLAARAIPFLLCTGAPEQSAARFAAVPMLRKPYGAEQLQAALAGLLGLVVP